MSGEIDDRPQGQRVLTIRVPAVLHQAIGEAAHDKRRSTNRFCVETLAHQIGRPDLIPPTDNAGRILSHLPEPDAVTP